MLKNSSVKCPRCASDQLHKFGRDPETKQQKFRCKKCRPQFIPGREIKRTQWY